MKNGVLSDPKQAEFAAVKTETTPAVVMEFLKIANADKFAFYSDANFIKAVTQTVDTINRGGIASALSDFLPS